MGPSLDTCPITLPRHQRQPALVTEEIDPVMAGDRLRYGSILGESFEPTPRSQPRQQDPTDGNESKIKIRRVRSLRGNFEFQ